MIQRVSWQFTLIVTCLALAAQASRAQSTQPSAAAWLALDGGDWAGWTGVDRAGDAAVLAVPGEAAYRVPDGPRGAYDRGLYHEIDGTLDARQWYGLRFDVDPDRGDATLTLDLTLSIPPQEGRHNFPPATAARVRVTGAGWHSVTVPIASFDYNRGQSLFLKYVKRLTVRATYDVGGASGRVRLRHARLVRANGLAVDAPVRSTPGDAGAQVAYDVTVTNCGDAPQLVGLSIQRCGWEGMTARVEPATLLLQPGEARPATLRVTVPAGIPAGGRERQSLVVAPQDGSTEPVSVDFTTLRRLPHPYLVHTAAEWADVRAKAAKYDWAKAAAARTIAAADAFAVPPVPPGGLPSDQGTQAVYKSYIEGRFFPVVVAWELTGDRRYAEKIALFLRQLADPATGYPVTLHAVTQGIPQEGGFFQACAEAYDAVADAGVLRDADRRLIEHMFRLYIDWNLDGEANGGISNWSLFNLCPAAECALAIQDLDRFDRLVDGTGGVIDHLRYGMMDDGWWYEMSLAYNLGCAEVATRLALAARPFGFDLLHGRFPSAMTKDVGLRPFEAERFEGMAFGKFGPLTQTSFTLKQMWDGITPYPDYRGIMFGMGDGHESVVAGRPFELAYYAFGDPAYAAVLKRGSRHDLVFGVPELPGQTPELFRTTAKSDDAGVAVLRSQTAGREPREQIQAAFKYGTHGGYHGHFDRLSLLSLMRYGRSFYNPETSWFGYGSYMYKWWVQASASHNMVVVDGKMQEPVECRTLLFHAGPMVQAIAAETTARWSNPPYFGGYDLIAKVRAGTEPFVPVPEPHPGLGDVTDFTEPVRQRRLMVVTDDYVLLADALKGARSHTFDNLMQLRGATVPDQPNVKRAGHAAQFDASPLSSGQFITDCDLYAGTAPVLVESVHRIGGGNRETGGAESLSEAGELHVDERVLWPARPQVVVGRYAESWPVNKALTYDVRADGKPLAGGTFGAWILGVGDVDVDVTGAKTLTLTTRVTRGKDVRKTVFWGDAVIVTATGERVPVSRLKPTTENAAAAAGENRDYDGGPVVIAGTPCATAMAAEPADAARPATITVDLTGLNAVRLKTIVGGDWPVGDEEQVRKTVSVRATGTAARFLTVLEPFEKQRAVMAAAATGPDQLRVELADGRVQEVTITGLDDDAGRVRVTVRETKGGQPTRTETAEPTDGHP